jgi:xylulokinase
MLKPVPYFQNCTLKMWDRFQHELGRTLLQNTVWLLLCRPGEIVVSLGTSATLFGVAGQPVIDPTCAVCPFCDATGAWLPLICTLNCTVPAEEVCAAFKMSHHDLTALAESETAGAEGVNFLPYLVGERTPNWPHSSGAVLGLKPGEDN